MLSTKVNYSALALGAALVGAVGIGAAHAADKAAIATATVLGTDGSVKGEARLTRKAAGVELKLTVRGLPAGVHGVHLHAAGSCNAPDFASAGPHLNPGGHMHGERNPQGSHLGDLPNIDVGQGGGGTLTAALTGRPADLAATLFDADGTAIVVHATADDYLTDPSGNSGGRIACGVITRLR